MMPTRAYLKVAGVAVQTFLRTVARVVGKEVINDVVGFFRAFEGMEEGFRARAQTVDELLRDERTAFVLVTSPRRDALDEAKFFTERLAQNNQRVEALIVNRVHPSFGDESPDGLRTTAQALRVNPSEGGERLAVLYDNLADFRTVAMLEREHIETDLPGEVVVYVPYLTRDVYDFDALHEVGRLLFDTVTDR